MDKFTFNSIINWIICMWLSYIFVMPNQLKENIAKRGTWLSCEVPLLYKLQFVFSFCCVVYIILTLHVSNICVFILCSWFKQKQWSLLRDTWTFFFLTKDTVYASKNLESEICPFSWKSKGENLRGPCVSDTKEVMQKAFHWNCCASFLAHLE